MENRLEGAKNGDKEANQEDMAISRQEMIICSENMVQKDQLESSCCISRYCLYLSYCYTRFCGGLCPTQTISTLPSIFQLNVSNGRHFQMTRGKEKNEVKLLIPPRFCPFWSLQIDCLPLAEATVVLPIQFPSLVLATTHLLFPSLVQVWQLLGHCITLMISFSPTHTFINKVINYIPMFWLSMDCTYDGNTIQPRLLIGYVLQVCVCTLYNVHKK